MKKFQAAMAVLAFAGLLSAVAIIANRPTDLGTGSLHENPSVRVTDTSPPIARGSARQIMYE